MATLLPIILHLSFSIFLSGQCAALLTSWFEPSHAFSNGKSHILNQLINGLLKVYICKLVLKLCHLCLLIFLVYASTTTGYCKMVRTLSFVLSFTHILLLCLYKNLTYINVSFGVCELWNACRAYVNWHIVFGY